MRVILLEAGCYKPTAATLSTARERCQEQSFRFPAVQPRIDSAAVMSRGLSALIVAIAAIGLFAASLAWLLDPPRPAPAAGRAERLYLAACAHCHGEDGRGSWRARLFLIRPGDLSDPNQASAVTDRYRFDIIKHGGAPIGRPGMPGFPHLSDADIQALVRYVRSLSAKR